MQHRQSNPALPVATLIQHLQKVNKTRRAAAAGLLHMGVWYMHAGEALLLPGACPRQQQK
jgi:hypothetical protein